MHQNGEPKSRPMKAVVYSEYGLPDVLKIEEVEKPVPKENEVLIKVHAVSLNASDWELLTGKPFYTRIWGLRKPKYRILGSDIAGRIEAVGKNIKQFKPGDEVFGDLFESWGGLAEYVCAKEDKLMLKPEFITFQEAAALPQAAVVALQGLRFNGEIKPGQKILIIGAGGGAGSFAIQLAKFFEAEVTGVDNFRKLKMMRSIGADHVIDYTQEDYTQKKGYDLILDLVGKRPVFDFKRMLNANGGYAIVGGTIKHILEAAFFGLLMSKTSTRKLGVLIHKQNQKDLKYILALYETGKIKPVIEKEFNLNETPEAFRYLGEGLARGKVMIKVAQ